MSPFYSYFKGGNFNTQRESVAHGTMKVLLKVFNEEAALVLPKENLNYWLGFLEEKDR